MKSRRKAALSAFIFISFFAIRPAHADSININFGSSGTAVSSAQSNSLGTTVAIDPSGSWASALAGSSWVSFAPTGNPYVAGYVSVANGTIVSFFDSFNLPGIGTGGSLTVMGDDSLAVFLNGVKLLSEGSSIGNQYRICSDFGSGCVSPTTIDLPASLLRTGENKLEFQVAQRAGGSFGLDYIGTVIDPVDAPEPAAGFLLGIGLLALSAVALLRMLQDA